LAKEHLLSLTDNDYRLTFSEVFEIEERVPGGGWIAPVQLEEALETFKRQVSEAQKNPEEPKAALLMAIASDGGIMPSSLSGIHPESRLSAVQDFLFTVWLNDQFQVNEGVFYDTRAVQYNLVSVKCPQKGKKKKAVKIKYMESTQASCMLEAKKTYKMAVKECFRDSLGCDGGDACLDKALAELQENVDLCAEVVDQGHEVN
jgi:hypothetical protein